MLLANFGEAVIKSAPTAASPISQLATTTNFVKCSIVPAAEENLTHCLAGGALMSLAVLAEIVAIGAPWLLGLLLFIQNMQVQSAFT